MFFTGFVLWSVLQSGIELLYYTDTICSTAKSDIPLAAMLIAASVSALVKLSLPFMFYKDVKHKQDAYMNTFYPFLLPWLLFSSCPSGTMALYNFDWLICSDRHYFFSIDFGYAFIFLSTLMHGVAFILALSMIAVKVRMHEMKKKELDVSTY